MSNTPSTEPTLAQKRSHAYGFLAALMEYPEGELTTIIRSGEIAKQAKPLFCSLYPTLESQIDWDGLADAGQEDDLSIEFTRLFDVGGADGPPCALNSGVYRGDARMRVLEELVRFYNYFGLTSAETEGNELPDHLGTQLEFMHFLTYNESTPVVEDEAGAEITLNEGELKEHVETYQRAERDFLQNHLGQWVPTLCERIKQNNALPYYKAVAELLNRFIDLDGRHVLSIVGHSVQPMPRVEQMGDVQIHRNSIITTPLSRAPNDDDEVDEF